VSADGRNLPTPVLRAPAGGLAALLQPGLRAQLHWVFALLRRWWPIAHLGKTYLVTRHDDVREVFLADADFPVPYADKLDVIMGGQPFFLGMDDGPDYRRDTEAMRLALRRDDLAGRLMPATLARAGALVDAAGGRLEVVDMARSVTFEVLCDYFGVSAPQGGDLRIWATRLFEFQFADGGNDPALRREVDVVAPALRAHVDGLIAARRAGGAPRDDVLGRCLAFQAAGRPGFSDLQIRSALIGFIVGGLPQPPMVVPQALDQLLRRPTALLAAQCAARQGDAGLLRRLVFEALRFDPLAPALMRGTRRDHLLAPGTRRATLVPAGAAVMVAFSSAMMDARRVADPARFRADRPACDTLHFGHGLHTCFGLHINQALIPLMLLPLLARPGLRRSPGADGRLAKQGVFARSLWVDVDPPSRR
jgi:cytochrome P450